MVLIATAIKYDMFNSRFERFLCGKLAHFCRHFLFGALSLYFMAGSRGQSFTLFIINQLNINMTQGSKHVQSGFSSSTNSFGSNSAMS